MDIAVLIKLAYESIWILIKISTPLMLIAIVVGLTISILQTTTSIQEQTLTFVPKLFAILLGLVVLGNWMMKMLVDYTIRLFNMIQNVI